MAKLIDTPEGPILCSRVNAGAAERGDLLVSEHGHRIYRIRDVRRKEDTGHVVLAVIVAGTGDKFRIPLPINDPVWRATGARSAGGVC